MGQHIVFGSGISSSIPHGTYFTISGASAPGNSTEELTETTLFKPGRLSRIEINYTATNGSTRNVYIRKNRSSDYTVGPSTSAIERIVYYPPLNVDSNDELNFYYTSSAATSAQFTSSLTYRPYGNNHFYLIGSKPSGESIGTGARYIHPIGGLTVRNDGASGAKIISPGTVKNMQVNIVSSAGSSGTFSTRYNATTGGALSIPYTAGTTGKLTDVTNSDSISSGDYIAYTVSPTGASVTVSLIGVMIENSTFGQDIGTAGNRTIPYSASALYLPIVGGNIQESSTESQRSLALGFPAKLKNLRIRVGATNTRTSSTTFTLRVAGSNVSQTISVPASTTNTWYEDTTNIDYCGPEDQISLETTGGTTGNLAIEQILLTIVDLSPPEYPRAIWNR